VAAKILKLRAKQACGAKKLSAALRQEGITVGHSTIGKILKEHGAIAQDDPSTTSWITKTFVAADPFSNIATGLPSIGIRAGFAEHLRRGLLPDRKKAVAVLARLKGIRLQTIAECLNLAPSTIVRYGDAFATGGLDALFRERKSKVNDDAHRAPLFALLHSPPSRQ
jgi:transposase